MIKFGNGIYAVDINNTITITFSSFCSHSPYAVLESRLRVSYMLDQCLSLRYNLFSLYFDGKE